MVEGKICIVTGANSGIGKVTAQKLADAGATVILACRNTEKATIVRQEIQQKNKEAKVDSIPCDLASFASIRAFVQTFQSRYSQLHLLINNAGLFSMQREETQDGFEMTFGTNHLGPFLLTNLLLPLIQKSAPARIINVSSAMHHRGKISFDDLQSQQSYNGIQAYSDSKLANVLFTCELARRLEKDGITVNCLHPGMVATNIWPGQKWYLTLGSAVIRCFARKPEKGAKTTLFLALSDDVASVTGKYFVDEKIRHTSRLAQQEDIQKQLWTVSEQLTQLQPSSH